MWSFVNRVQGRIRGEVRGRDVGVSSVWLSQNRVKANA